MRNPKQFRNLTLKFIILSSASQKAKSAGKSLSEENIRLVEYVSTYQEKYNIENGVDLWLLPDWAQPSTGFSDSGWRTLRPMRTRICNATELATASSAQSQHARSSSR